MNPLRRVTQIFNWKVQGGAFLINHITHGEVANRIAEAYPVLSTA